MSLFQRKHLRIGVSGGSERQHNTLRPRRDDFPARTNPSTLTGRRRSVKAPWSYFRQPGDYVRHASYPGLAKLIRVADDGQAFVLLFGRLLQVPAAEIEKRAPGHAPSIVPSADTAPIAVYSGTAAKGKPRMQRYREDWNNDTSLFHEVQNAVAGIERRTDEEAQAWSMRRDGGRGLLNKPVVTTIAPGITLTTGADRIRQAPAMPSKRELQRRLGKHQQHMVRAFELWQAETSRKTPRIAHVESTTYKPTF
jgi:hypothetical protein